MKLQRQYRSINDWDKPATSVLSTTNNLAACGRTSCMRSCDCNRRGPLAGERRRERASTDSACLLGSRSVALSYISTSVRPYCVYASDRGVLSIRREVIAVMVLVKFQGARRPNPSSIPYKAQATSASIVRQTCEAVPDLRSKLCQWPA